MRLRVILFLCGLVAVTRVEASFTVTFQPAALPSGNKLISQWEEQDLLFTTPQGLLNNDISSGLFPYDGGAYLQCLAGEQPLTITTVDGKAFSLYAVDLAEYSTALAVPKAVTFTGTRGDFTTATVTFTTDGVIDGNGALADFQTFVFPEAFSNLNRVAVSTDSYSMDNLQGAVVPEASTWVLTAIGCGGVMLGRRRGGDFRGSRARGGGAG